MICFVSFKDNLYTVLEQDVNKDNIKSINKLLSYKVLTVCILKDL